MDGFSLANPLRCLRDRRAQQFASDSVTCSLEPSDQRCASRKQRRKCARKLRDLKFEERVSKHRQTELGDTLLKFQVAQFSRTLSTLLTGGTPLVAGLQTASDAITSKLLRSTVNQATQMVREGESMHAALAAKGVMPELALDMIEVGESSGALAPMLNSVAEFYEEEVSLRLSALVSLIEPILLIFMGLLVAFILISLYLPIFSFSMTGAVK